jgi:hypothetical protein
LEDSDQFGILFEQSRANFAEQLRGIIDPKLSAYERVIGLTVECREFRSKLTDAIIGCVFTHMVAPRRVGDIRKDLAKASRAAQSARKNLSHLADVLDSLPSRLNEALVKAWGTSGEISRRSLGRPLLIPKGRYGLGKYLSEMTAQNQPQKH